MQDLVVGGHRLECEWIGDPSEKAPLVFLHEGLGSVELWRAFPRAVVEASGRRALTYSRYGNGWSAPLTAARTIDYMHEEALVLAQLVEKNVGSQPILVGHSDGASIAIIYAGRSNPVGGMVLIAPHVFVETITYQSIDALRTSFPGSEMAKKMGKYHRDPERTFWGWNDIWLDPAFQRWNLEEFLAAITCPVLLVQGDADEFGTMKQLDAIESGVRGPVERLVVPDAGHAPHLDEPELVVMATASFLARFAGS